MNKIQKAVVLKIEGDKEKELNKAISELNKEGWLVKQITATHAPMTQGDGMYLIFTAVILSEKDL